MRLYHVEAAAVAANADTRWVDNLVSRFPVVGVARGGNGRTRKLRLEAVQQVVLARTLVEQLEIPVGKAVDLAAALLGKGLGAARVGPWFQLHVDLAALHHE